MEYEGGERSTDRYKAVHVVTAEEAAAGTFRIIDVVLPMPGSHTRMPEHETAQVGFIDAINAKCAHTLAGACLSLQCSHVCLEGSGCRLCKSLAKKASVDIMRIPAVK